MQLDSLFPFDSRVEVIKTLFDRNRCNINKFRFIVCKIETFISPFFCFPLAVVRYHFAFFSLDFVQVQNKRQIQFTLVYAVLSRSLEFFTEQYPLLLS